LIYITIRAVAILKIVKSTSTTVAAALQSVKSFGFLSSPIDSDETSPCQRRNDVTQLVLFAYGVGGISLTFPRST